MSTLNKVILIGNLGADPESRELASGDAVCNLRLATTEKWKSKSSGETMESTEWHRVVLYRRLAEVAARYLRKGSSVYIEGRLKTRKWQDSEGRERYTTEIEATEMKLLTGHAPPGDAPHIALSSARKPAAKPEGGTVPDYLDQDIPF